MDYMLGAVMAYRLGLPAEATTTLVIIGEVAQGCAPEGSCILRARQMSIISRPITLAVQ